MLNFDRHPIAAKFIDPSGPTVEKSIEIRTHPINGRTSRIAFNRINRIIFDPFPPDRLVFSDT